MCGSSMSKFGYAGTVIFSLQNVSSYQVKKQKGSFMLNLVKISNHGTMIRKTYENEFCKVLVIIYTEYSTPVADITVAPKIKNTSMPEITVVNGKCSMQAPQWIVPTKEMPNYICFLVDVQDLMEEIEKRYDELTKAE